MFINGSALAAALRFLAVAIVVLAGLLVAHLVWVRRLACSPGLATKPLPARILLVGAALATPVLGFYAVEIAALWRRRAAVAWGTVAGRIAGLAVLTLALAAIGAASAEARYVPEYRTVGHTVATFVRLLRALLVAQVLLFMILRVFLGSRRPVLVWDAFLIAAALLVLLLA